MSTTAVDERRTESARKLLHLATGVVCMTFPWLFATIRPVVGIALAGLFMLVVVRTTRLRASSFGRMLHGVARTSHGELYLALGIAALFIATQGQPVLYVACLAVVTFADAAAALVGVRFGRIRYRVGIGTKTLEGSAAFVAIAFVAIVCALGTMGAAPFAYVALAGFAAACLLAVLEAFAVDGIDNLVLPLGSLALLHLMLGALR